MATQIVELDLGAASRSVAIRDDVSAVMVLVTVDGRPVRLARIPRPADGRLSSEAFAVPDHRGQGSRETLSPEPQSLSIVIPTRERPDDLERCLTALAPLTASGHEVIVVDSGPKTERTAAVASRHAVRYIAEPLPGANRARNAGLKASTRDIVAFIDDDVVVSASWSRAIAAGFSEGAGCVTGLVLPLELETDAQEAFELYCAHRRDLERHVYTRRVLRASAAGIVGMGANMAFRRELLFAVGGFDERLGPGTKTRTGDETDMFARILDAGQTIAYTPDAYVWHRHRRTSAEVRSCVFGYGVGLYSVLTKRVVEGGDLAAGITAVRWLVGPVWKAAQAKLRRRSAAPWSVVLAETAGAAFGPFCFGYETWRRGRVSGS